jgi:hypothetical protein
MYIIAVIQKTKEILFLQKDKKLVDYISEYAMFDVYSEAVTASKRLKERTEVYPLKEFILNNLETLAETVKEKFAE